MVALVVEGARVVQRQCGLLHAYEVAAGGTTLTGLVAQGPHDDAGVVAVGQDHPLHPIDHGIGPHRVVAGNVLAPYPVRLKVALVHDVQAQFVGQVIQDLRVRVVAGPDGVDVELLGLRQIVTVAVPGHRPPVIGVEVVPVDTLEHDALPVDEQLFIDDLDAAHPGPGALDVVDRVPAHQGRGDLVQVRCLGGPRRCVRHGDVEHHFVLAGCEIPRIDQFPLAGARAAQVHRDGLAATDGRRRGQVHLHAEGAVPVGR